jgi:hypothetical protein
MVLDDLEIGSVFNAFLAKEHATLQQATAYLGTVDIVDKVQSIRL